MGVRASIQGLPTRVIFMARKPNYNFERQERDRRKAEKKAAKAAAKAEKAERAKAEREGVAYEGPSLDDAGEPE